MKQATIDARDEADTNRLGLALAEILPDGVVALIGTLGAGKTRLVQMLATGCGIDREEVVSPTFVLCHEYHGRRTIYHFDAYRLRDSREFLDMGVEDYFSAPAISLVEWGHRVADVLPSDRLEIHLEVVSETARRFILSSIGDAMSDVPERVLEHLGISRKKLSG